MSINVPQAILSGDQIANLKRRIATGEDKPHVPREPGVSPETVLQYLRAPVSPPGMAAYFAGQETFKSALGCRRW
jgi:hypothetical protein